MAEGSVSTALQEHLSCVLVLGVPASLYLTCSFAPMYVKTITYSGDQKERKGKNKLFPVLRIAWPFFCLFVSPTRDDFTRKHKKNGPMSRRNVLFESMSSKTFWGHQVLSGDKWIGHWDVSTDLTSVMRSAGAMFFAFQAVFFWSVHSKQLACQWPCRS